MSDPSRENDVIEITGLSHDARGVGHLPAKHSPRTSKRVVSGLRRRLNASKDSSADRSSPNAAKGKACFVSGALPGETVRWRVTESKDSFSQGELVEVLNPSAHRVAPPCEYYDLCGGCELQHLSADAQPLEKERQLRLMFSRAGIEIEHWLPPIVGSSWGYRRRTRLAVTYKRGGVELGYRQRAGHDIVEIDHCMTLDPDLDRHIPALPSLIPGLKQADLSEVELIRGDKESAVCLSVSRSPSELALERIRDYCAAQSLQLWMRIGKADAVVVPPSCASADIDQPHEGSIAHQGLATTIEEGLDVHFRPGQFVQVNADVNRSLVGCVIDLLDTKPNYRVLDLFCGAGNFSLPIARRVQEVVGVEGLSELVVQAEQNAERANISNVEFRMLDLFGNDVLSGRGFGKNSFDCIMLDPPRAGAKNLMSAISRLCAKKVIYVSCHPATLVRDARVLIEGGYRLSQVAAVDMFPHTRHLESVALFELMS